MMLEQQRCRPDLWEGEDILGTSVFEDWVDNQDIGTEEWLEAAEGNAKSIIRVRTAIGAPAIV